MSPVPFTCNRQAYRDHYGHGLETFVGEVNQDGYGLGNFLAGLFRKAVPLLSKHVLPVLKTTAVKAGKNLLRSGANVAKDVILEEKNFKESLKRRAKTGLQDLISDITSGQQGQGRRVKRLRQTPKRRKTQTDIFS